MSITVSGKFYPSGRSECLPVTAKMDDSFSISILDQSNDMLHHGHISDLQIAEKLGSVPREIVIRDVWLLVVESNREIDNWLAEKNIQNKVARLEGKRSVVVACAILVPLLLFGIFKYAIPGAAIYFASYVPQPIVEIASQHTLKALDATLLNETEISEQVQTEYQRNWAEVIDRLDMSDAQFFIQFRKSEKMGANAFALPDGTIVITDELVELLDGESDVLTAILLHEIGHVEHNHSMRLISEALATSLAINYFFADLGDLIEFFAGVSNAVLQNQFSRELEWEADNFALSKLDALGMEREAFATAMEKLASTIPEQSKVEVLMQSHPLMRDRIQNARNGKSE